MSRQRPGSRYFAALDRKRWALARLRAFERDGWRCSRCGRAGRLEGHHEPPLREGGDPYHVDGIVTLCRGCHIEHHRHEDEISGRAAWRALVSELADEKGCVG